MDGREVEFAELAGFSLSEFEASIQSLRWLNLMKEQRKKRENLDSGKDIKQILGRNYKSSLDEELMH